MNMETLFTSDFFASNRARLRELFTGTAPIVITANGQLQRSGDTTYPFQQDANFWYLTGLQLPDVVLVIDKDKEYLILPERSSYQVTFDGDIDTQALSACSGIQNIYEYNEGWQLFTNRLKKVKHVATISPPPQYVDVYGMYTNPARRMLIRRIKGANENIELLDLQQHLTRLRMVKQHQEIVAIIQAIEITKKGLQAVTRSAALKKYAYEFEIEADLTRAFRKSGSDHAFDPIIAGGRRACTLHNTKATSALSADELLLFDIGAHCEGYAADISRTVSLKSPTKRQQAIFDAVEDVQKYAYALLRPGVSLRDSEEQIEQYMGEKLRELGLIKTINSDAVREFYPHAASHHLGLQVHDVDDRRSLEPGMVITVEPGIYVPTEGIGVRIEDDVLITEAGIEILSASIPTRLV
jgi:Xaa-Pro aminopeptidase